jgi:hypothetical protein
MTEPFNDRRRQAAATDPADAANARVRLGNAADLGRCPVRAVVVHINHFPGDATERGIEPGDQPGDIRSLTITWYDHRQARGAASKDRNIDQGADGMSYRPIMP